MKKSFFKPATAAASLRLLLSASALCLLSACVSYQGIQSQAQLKTLTAQAGAFPDQGGNAGWPDLQWASSIGGAELQALIDRALANHPSLQAAAARLQAAQAATAFVGANKLPSANLSVDSTYQRFTEHGLVPPPLAGTYNTNNQISFNATYELDFWGKHSAEMRGALSQEKVAEAEAQSVRLMLSNAIARAWLQLARQNAQLELSKQQLAVREQFDSLTQQRVKAGLDTKVEVQQNLVQLSGLKNDIAQWQEAMALTRNQIAALQGLGPEEGKLIVTPKFAPAADVALPGNLPLELLGRRPDIVSARWRVEAGQGDIEVARTQFYPNINIAGFVGLSSLGLSNLANSGSGIIGAGPAIRLPIFEGGRLRAQLKGKVAAYDVAVATYNQSLTDALHEVADQVQILQASQSQLAEQQAAEQAARVGLQLAQQRQKAGTANKLPVLAAESAVLSQQKLSLDLAVRHTEARINLIKALGGGYESKALPATNVTAASTNQTVTQSLVKNTPEAAL
ncbi:outer membrane protein [Undibacterium sp. KW1]|uniref:efflux transporter outer membrane subunit n=1 Tax=Undibacterium sp. KW1 TaxID=2058624 RepID=UPI001331F62E|nr:efflux transporter outer membrane subunit [Undibacterium sp. KW1]BBB62826.1 outer membrane protein [Undibacterium sp. KW1]